MSDNTSVTLIFVAALAAGSACVKSCSHMVEASNAITRGYKQDVKDGQLIWVPTKEVKP